MKLAVDIGSNTVKCLLGERRGGRVVKLYEKSLDFRISAGAGVLVEDAASLIIKALNIFTAEAHRACASFSVEAVATSALRDAPNAREIIAAVYAATKIKIEVLRGEREAELSYLGAMSDPSIPQTANLAYFDLGGGSMELVFGSCGRVGDAFSLPLGAVRLTKKFFPNTKISAAEISALRAFARSELERTVTFSDFDTLAGAGGAVVAARFMKIRMGLGGAENEISLSDIEAMLALSASLDASERVSQLGVSAGRADIIPAAFAAIAELMTFLRAQKLLHTFCNMRCGMILCK